MDFLLWIALAGVIVFLLGLLYSKFISSKAQQPATNTIAPAKTPVAANSMGREEEKAKTPPAPPSVKMVLPETKQPDTDKKPAQDAPAKTKAKTVPAAEPVGPAHSKADVAPAAPLMAQAPVKSEKPHIEVSQPLSKEPEAIVEPQPVTEPELLKKPRQGTADDLTQISGIGKAIQNKLYAIGIFHYDQLADLNEMQINWLNRNTGFAGRAERENWCAQAKKLAAKSTAPAAPLKRAVKKAAKPASKTTAKAKPKTAKKSETMQ